ncbi:DUF4236 domain-containing protein [Aquimarina sp. I32.4]|uniref:DUF4236 domain-containing protein n=1 Tax=Aquimarina sp. I32.4 TaxID=2053903 RepID=UPI000CDEB433|nr:DUF4236 domain-containing protein [Aquimarina sp. I32.4]
MAFRYYKRIKLGKRLGINISKSGIYPSYRSKIGTISSRGYSVKTGISGLSYRKSFKKGKGCLLLFIMLISINLSLFVILLL